MAWLGWAWLSRSPNQGWRTEIGKYSTWAGAAFQVLRRSREGKSCQTHLQGEQTGPGASLTPQPAGHTPCQLWPGTQAFARGLGVRGGPLRSSLSSPAGPHVAKSGGRSEWNSSRLSCRPPPPRFLEPAKLSSSRRIRRDLAKPEERVREPWIRRRKCWRL